MHIVYLLLGSNLGDRSGFLQQATEMISIEVGKVLKSSSVYQTASWGNEKLPEYLNQVLLVHTAKSPQEILHSIQLIEKLLKRKRTEKWGSRTIDIDILFFDQEEINDDNLIIPHPLLHTRRFTLAPLQEIAGSFVHPVMKMDIETLYKQLSDDLSVKRINEASKILMDQAFEVDLSYLNDIAGGNVEFIIDMIDIFLEQTPLYFNQLGEAIQNEDWKATGDLAHKIKPTLAFIGADHLREKMAALETSSRQLSDLDGVEGLFKEINDACLVIYPGLERAKAELLAQ